jgi:hypothetical protein
MSERRHMQIDPAIEAIMGSAEQRARQRRMTPAERRQAKRDAQRERVTLELDPALMAMVRQIAEAEGISPAGVINLLLVPGIEKYAAGEIDFGENTRPSRSPRYEWVVELQGLEELARKLNKSGL